MTERMTWASLLSPVRIRQLMGDDQKSPGDHRSEFRRDYDRVVFSSPVRRLQDKAQVFPLEPNDAVRTRLTHSLEVSSVARGLTERVTDELVKRKEMTPEQAEHATTITSTAGLIHDLGNPPFGHSGEDAVREWFQNRWNVESRAAKQGTPAWDVFANLSSPEVHETQLAQDLLRFEGNAETVRLLCNLQILADRWGLNLTAGTLSVALKYIASSTGIDKDDHSRSKPGYFFAEQAVVEKVQAETGTVERRNPLTFLVEAADDCVYSLVDIEDGVKKGVATWHDVSNALRDAIPMESKSKREIIDKKIREAEAYIDDRLKTSGVALPRAAKDYAYAQEFRILGAITIIAGAANAFLNHYRELMAGRFKGELVKDEQAGESLVLVTACKAVGRQIVYPTRQNVELELRGKQVIHDLMDLLWPGVRAYDGEDPRPKDFVGKAWALISENYRTVFKADWIGIADRAGSAGYPEAALKQYYRLLLLTDYVAGMTDSFACNLHRSLKNG